MLVKFWVLAVGSWLSALGKTLAPDSQEPTAGTLFNGNQVRQVSVPAIDLQSVPGIRLGGGLEGAEIDGEVDRARVGPVEEGYQLEAGRTSLTT